MIRPARPTDLAFVKKTWFDTFKLAGGLSGLMNPLTYRQRSSALIDELAATSTVLIAADEEDDDVILGWVAFRGPVLHYVFVRPVSRHRGLMPQLLQAAGNLTTYSHRTHDWQRVTAKRSTLAYDPFAAWRFDGHREDRSPREAPEHVGRQARKI
jgi:hypothetical protein